MVGDTELVETEDGMYRLEGDTEREVDPEEFDGQKVAEPGIYRDKTREEGESDTETYTIIVSRSFLTPKNSRNQPSSEIITSKLH